MYYTVENLWFVLYMSLYFIDYVFSVQQEMGLQPYRRYHWEQLDSVEGRSS